jgi:hypothetical protein
VGHLRGASNRAATGGEHEAETALPILSREFWSRPDGRSPLRSKILLAQSNRPIMGNTWCGVTTEAAG